MLGFILLSIFILIVITIVVSEIRNERNYQEKRHQKHKQNERKDKAPTTQTQRRKLTKKLIQKKPIQEKKQPKKKKLPNCNYPLFTHERLIEMGLSDGEAKEFVEELIPQLEIQIPLLEEALKKEDFHQMERLTHSIKGSATNLGTGGVADLLVECNTYLKTGTDSDIAKVYLDSLKHYTQTLKEQYA